MCVSSDDIVDQIDKASAKTMWDKSCMDHSLIVLQRHDYQFCQNERVMSARDGGRQAAGSGDVKREDVKREVWVEFEDASGEEARIELSTFTSMKCWKAHRRQ